MRIDPDRQVDAAEVSAYYDDFRDARMLKYRIQGNPRIDRAVERVISYLKPTSRVLEVGCGIGMVTERIARQVTRGHVSACDISPKNIELARRTVGAKNASFFVADVVGDFAEVAARLSTNVDVIAMIDVLEHLPLPQHEQLFLNLRAVMSTSSVIVITYPSPQYQRYLREHEPQELQIIDEIVELPTLMNNATRAGMHLRHFSLEDVWRRNQYVHCILQTDQSVDPLATTPPTGLRRMANSLRQRARLIRGRLLLKQLRLTTLLSRSLPGGRSVEA